MTVTAILLAVTAFCQPKVNAQNTHYYDYGAMEEAATGKLRAYLKANPHNTLDSVRRHVVEGLTDGHVGKASDLAPVRKKKLTPQDLFKLARKSSLVFGKMEHNEAYKLDSAYKNASGVALTPDGICATNYHVIADFLLGGALGKTDKNDMLRFAMDCDGDVFPLTAVLAVDPINDWAIVKVDPNGKKFTPAPMGDDLPVGTPVFCLANPSGATFHFTEGMVSNCTRKPNKRTGVDKYILEITADYGVGASGGPIFDECGNLVALVSSTFSLYAQPEQYRNFQMSYKQTVPIFLLKECFTDK